VVLDEIVRILGADALVVNARGMREGIVLEVIERERGLLPVADRMRSVRELGSRYGYDAAHAEHVRYLALRLFDDLAPALDLDPKGGRCWRPRRSCTTWGITWRMQTTTSTAIT